MFIYIFFLTAVIDCGTILAQKISQCHCHENIMETLFENFNMTTHTTVKKCNKALFFLDIIAKP